MKVLVCAYACDPLRGSEGGVGWGWVNAIAQHHEVWVLTAAFHRGDLEKAACSDLKNHQPVHFRYVDEKPWHYRPTRTWMGIESSIAKPIMNWAYRSWLRDAFALGTRLHREVGFDLVHQLTYVGFRFPGHLWKLDVPFVWGPIGGLENTSWRLLPVMGVRGAAYYAARNVVNSAHKTFLRAPRSAFSNASAVIAATSGIQSEILRAYGVQSQVICEVGAPSDLAPQLSRRHAGEPLRIAWSGLHLPGKALALLLRALRAVPGDWHLDVYGDGPQRRDWQRMASRFGIDARCTWHGQLSRDEPWQGCVAATCS